MEAKFVESTACALVRSSLYENFTVPKYRGFWWHAAHLTLTRLRTQVTHNTRGVGTVVLLEKEGLQRVHVEFLSGEKHRYMKESWSKLFALYDIFRNTFATDGEEDEEEIAG